MTFEQCAQLLGILKWPFVVLALFFIAIFVFRPQFTAFLSRVTSIGKEGLKIDPVLDQQNQPDRNKEAQDLMKALDSAVVNEQERVSKTNLQKRGLEHSGVTIDVLVRFLANSQLTVAFEEVYRLILGSQIFIVKRINESRILKRSIVEEHFHRIQAQFPTVFADSDVDHYMSFLLTKQVVLYADDQYAITPFGNEFLAWIVHVGAPENKPF